MSTDNHTAIATGAAANAATFNSPLGQLDAAIGNVASLTVPGSPASAVEALEELLDEIGTIASLDVGDGSATDLVTAANDIQEIIGVDEFDETLKGWASAEAWELTAITYHATVPGLILSATIKWPDASGGTFTTTTQNTVWKTTDAFTATHTVSGKTVTQTAVTRNAFGWPTTKPAMTVA